MKELFNDIGGMPENLEFLETEVDWSYFFEEDNNFPPKWNDKDQYPNFNKEKAPSSVGKNIGVKKKTKHFTYTQWGWEFLRRSADYQKDYLENTKIENAEDREADSKQKALSYGLTCGLLDPTRTKIKPSFINNFLGTKIHIDANYVTNMADNQIAVVFDLTYPIEAQLIHMASRLKDYQQYAFGKRMFSKKKPIPRVEERRFQKECYQDYLQILDAVTLGVSKAEIAKELYPDTPNTYDTDFAGNKRVNGAIIAATEMTKSGYMQFFIWEEDDPNRREFLVVGGKLCKKS